MNLYLVDLACKWLGILFVSLASFLGIYQEDKIVTENTNKNMSLNMTTEIIAHGTEIKYNSAKPQGEKNVLVSGEDGYLIRNNDNGSAKIMKNAVNEVVEVGTHVDVVSPSGIAAANVNPLVQALASVEVFTGKLTAYGGDCNGCSGGRVAYVSHNLLTQGFFYTDKTYGSLRILSAAKSKFPAGTIIELTTNTEVIDGIVLDWGGSMESAWRRGSVWIDLAFSTQAQARSYGSKTGVQFDVKRYGW